MAAQTMKHGEPKFFSPGGLAFVGLIATCASGILISKGMGHNRNLKAMAKWASKIAGVCVYVRALFFCCEIAKNGTTLSKKKPNKGPIDDLVKFSKPAKKNEGMRGNMSNILETAKEIKMKNTLNMDNPLYPELKTPDEMLKDLENNNFRIFDHRIKDQIKNNTYSNIYKTKNDKITFEDINVSNHNPRVSFLFFFFMFVAILRNPNVWIFT